jgi:hypothetical protein
MKISTNQRLTTIMIGQGIIKAHLHRFKLIDSATYPCRDSNDQTIDHFLYECEILKTQRDSLKLTAGLQKIHYNKRTLHSI